MGLHGLGDNFELPIHLRVMRARKSGKGGFSDVMRNKMIETEHSLDLTENSQNEGPDAPSIEESMPGLL